MNRKMNIFISFDLEGISGVSSWREMKKDSPHFNLIKKLATADVNATIRGIRKASQDIGEILVCDSHAMGENLLIDELEKGAHLIKGSPRNYYMMEGLNKNFDVVFFIGYHTMVGTKSGLMDHSYSSSSIYNIKINRLDVGETEINAAIAGYYGVPVGLVTGDDLLIKEVKKFLGNRTMTVITKSCISRFAAKCRHPIEVQEEIEAKAAKALKIAKTLKPFTFRKPIYGEIDVINSLIGDVIEKIPGLKRVTARKFICKTENILEFYRLLMLICDLAAYANTVLT